MTTNGTSTSSTTQTGALRGVRVLDFGHYIPGPLLGMLLADQGAEVIKVERPEGDPARSRPAFATWNRGKRSVVLDLKSPEGREKAQALARQADVVVENFRPGVADRLGIGYTSLSENNPGLVYCSLPGFGEDSPNRHRRGWETVVAASTGAYQPVEGTNGEPLFLPLPVASTFAAILGSASVAMALVARQRSGSGQRVEVPLHSAMFAAMGRHLVKLHEMETEDQFSLPRNVMSRQYQCADGRWVQNHGMYRRFVSQFMEAAGRPEWIEPLAAEYGRNVDPETLELWSQRFKDLFLQKTSKEWEDAIARTGGACTICKTVEEWLEHEHPREGKMVVEVEDANLGTMKQPGVQVRLRGTPGGIQGRAPLLGEHTEEVLSEVASDGASRATVPAAPREEIAGALQGVRVLDLCIVLAGPTCGRTLAEFGADVVKIDDPDRPYDVEGSIDVNRGKRSILLDLKSEQGREVFWRLVESADVVLENNRKGAMERMGLGYEDVKKRKPDIIYASMNAFGYDGPWAERPGWEQLAQATSGIQVRRGGRDGAPKLLPYPMNDYGTGLLSAYAVALALHERNRTGRGQSVDTGLALTAGLLQSPYFLDYPGYQRQEPEGLGVRGYSALSRLYQASDGWFYLRCSGPEAWGRLTSLPQLVSLASDPRFATPEGREENGGSLAEALSAIFREGSRQHWLRLLNDAGVDAMGNTTIPEFRDDQYVRQAGLVVTRQHPGRGRADHLGSTARLSATPMSLASPTPVLGMHTVDILAEAGYSQPEIEALLGAGAAARVEV